MGPDTLLKQLRSYTLILDALKEKKGYQEIQSHLANLLRIGINKVDTDALDAVTVGRDAVQVDVNGKSTIIGSLYNEFVTILALVKESRETEKQLVAIEQLIKRRNDDTLQAVSQSFKIPIYDTGRVTLLIEKFLDNRGNFIRHQFDPMLDELSKHGNHAFQLMWCYFKAARGRANRVPFLNAMQHLISRINRPKHALRFLLTDFSRHPEEVEVSDRNAIMLANILLRTYNKELDVDIEMTPEEVLNVRKGLDKDMVHYARFRIDSVEYRFVTKIHSIHQKLIALLNETVPGNPLPSIRHLLYLEREIFIFLALLSGKTAHTILISALAEYGDSQSGIYRYLRSANYIPVFLQHLKIIVRGIGRVGTPDDVRRLKKIGESGLSLSQFNGSVDNRRSVARTMEWIENVIRNLQSTESQAS